MKNTSYSIQIPVPCHKDWNKMSPDAKGKFCTSCSKSVVDFSTKTDPEIRNLLSSLKDQKVCGHFRSSQLNRSLNLSVNLDNLPTNMSSSKKFTLALFMVFGTLLFNCTDLKGQKINDMTVHTENDMHYTKGKIKMPRPISREDTIPEIKDSVLNLTPPEPMISGDIRFIEIPIEEIPIEEIPETLKDSLKCNEDSFMRGELMEIKAEPMDTTSEAKQEFKDLESNFLPIHAISLVEPELSVYPNPSKGEFYISYAVLKKSDICLDLFDVNGGWVKTLVKVDGQYEGRYVIPVELNDQPNGIYVIVLINEGKRYTKKVVFEK